MNLYENIERDKDLNIIYNLFELFIFESSLIWNMDNNFENNVNKCKSSTTLKK